MKKYKCIFELNKSFKIGDCNNCPIRAYIYDEKLEEFICKFNTNSKKCPIEEVNNV